MKIIQLLVVVAAVLTAAAGAPAVTPGTLRRLNREEGAASKRRSIEITHPYVPGSMPVDPSHPQGLPSFSVPRSSIKNGEMANTMDFTLNSHWGTHLDAPGYLNQTLLEQGRDIDSLNLDTLSGPCWVVDTPRGKNITSEVMEGLGIPRGVERVLFKTLNTDRKLMNQPRFDPSYTAFTPDGAQYLVSNTDIKLVGIDYLSVGVGVEEDSIAVHRTFLNTLEIIPVEGLKLDEVEPGVYDVDCLPLSIPTLDGSPARCILATVGSSGSSSSPGLLAVFFLQFVTCFLFFA
ncbi:unnamed protein product [Cuscuta campestris]|uniref:Cyclase n=1 Tax=Cuscuta campestris TaxID=132261 RepID=A0A484LQE3_9ASTE|nr:unnamed protein product [Cuscuta campestris]VFQ78733.1 unnamed protein product [Cuscuta campestris]